MKKIKDKYYKIEYGCIYLYYEDLVNIIEIINKNFKEYKLKFEDYEITNEDDINIALKEIKKEGIEVVYDLDLDAKYLLNNNDYASLNINIDTYNSKISTFYSNNEMIRGIMAKLDEILSLRVKKFRNMFQSTYFIFIFGTLLFYPILRFGIDLINNFDILLLGVVFLLVFLLGIFFIFSFPGKFNKSKIYLLKYNEKNSWYSKIKQHMGELILLIVGTFIGGVIVALVSYFFL
ncbi:hypothetical protein MBBAR_1c02310 [Methanobrevibacter arboriphilus JCM 13429 = DSM 1125]|uniref:Uncharacterized protein n=1 Tax=Methanobrevibacter arboriphilus JCM 13429 = DSM 1125 TaxID=1300164 RepID=A0A1V6N5F9_METAZ|nr:hypothetical protein [Methanobrevibacter arboriphilus]OQD59823.1 hypothetical protein MBBAR_1c02310 [Methanobrevibacter arboriphilus JCM 13429 = DSM 1125]